MKKFKIYTKIIILFSLSFGTVVTTKNISDASEQRNLNNKPLFIAQKERSTSGRLVGTVQCSAVSINDSSQNSQKNIIKASLSNNPSGGFIFKMKLAGRNDDIQ